MTGSAEPQLNGAAYVVRQQLYTVHQNFEVFDASGSKIMSAHGNGLRVMDKLELRDASGKAVLELRERPGKRPKVNVLSKGKKILSVSERRVGIRDHFVIETPLPASFEIVGNAWSTAYSITIDGDTAAQIRMEPGLAKADSYRVVVAGGKAPRILFGVILAVDILAHKGKR